MVKCYRVLMKILYKTENYYELAMMMGIEKEKRKEKQIAMLSTEEKTTKKMKKKMKYKRFKIASQMGKKLDDNESQKVILRLFNQLEENKLEFLKNKKPKNLQKFCQNFEISFPKRFNLNSDSSMMQSFLNDDCESLDHSSTDSFDPKNVDLIKKTEDSSTKSKKKKLKKKKKKFTERNTPLNLPKDDVQDPVGIGKSVKKKRSRDSNSSSEDTKTKENKPKNKLKEQKKKEKDPKKKDKKLKDVKEKSVIFV